MKPIEAIKLLAAEPIGRKELDVALRALGFKPHKACNLISRYLRDGRLRREHEMLVWRPKRPLGGVRVSSVRQARRGEFEGHTDAISSFLKDGLKMRVGDKVYEVEAIVTKIRRL